MLTLPGDVGLRAGCRRERDQRGGAAQGPVHGWLADAEQADDLGDQATLDSEGYTRQQALQRLSGDLTFHGYPDDAETWITGIQAAL